MKLIDENKDVPLLSVENIIDVLRNELLVNPDNYAGILDSEVLYIELKQGYVGISDEDKYYIVPAWRLSQFHEEVDTHNVIYINAIDGTVLNPYNVRVVYE